MNYENYKFELKPLPYAYEALEPYIDAETMHFHHDKHLQTYVNNLNNALEKYPELYNWNLKKLVKEYKKLPEEIQIPIKNNAGGVFNHNFYFDNIGNASKNEPSGSLKTAIENTFGSFENFKTEFKTSALGRFGSGYAWLVSNSKKEISLLSTANQDTPLNLDLIPILTVDVWEHAYYLKYKNLRATYLDNWFNVVNWDKISNNFEELN
jgi:Fe-Mn family superoxide dismutase